MQEFLAILARKSIPIIAEVVPSDAILFGFAVLGVFFLLFGAFWLGWRISHRAPCLSPYSGMPLRRCSDLSYYSVERVLRYLYELQDYENRIIDLRYAAFCRETGRIFPNSITWFDTVDVDWNFLNKRFRGNFVSWGSLTAQQHEMVREKHETLDGFQTEISSPSPSPRSIEPQYALQKPGPLYVDVGSYVLIGWKLVPSTELEILIVQRPKPEMHYPHLDM